MAVKGKTALIVGLAVLGIGGGIALAATGKKKKKKSAGAIPDYVETGDIQWMIVPVNKQSQSNLPVFAAVHPNGTTAVLFTDRPGPGQLLRVFEPDPPGVDYDPGLRAKALEQLGIITEDEMPPVGPPVQDPDAQPAPAPTPAPAPAPAPPPVQIPVPAPPVQVPVPAPPVQIPQVPAPAPIPAVPMPAEPPVFKLPDELGGGEVKLPKMPPVDIVPPIPGPTVPIPLPQVPTPAPAPIPAPAPEPAPPPPPPAAETPTALPAETAELLSVMLADEQTGNWKREYPELGVWQAKRKLTADRKFGPGTAKRLAAETGLLPIVRYWPKGSQKNRAVEAYRQALYALAADAESPRADQLLAAAQREQGQSFGTPPQPITQFIQFTQPGA